MATSSNIKEKQARWERFGLNLYFKFETAPERRANEFRWQHENHHEANIWLFHTNGQVRFYQTSQSQISKAEDILGISIKRDSTTARQALLPINI